MGITSGRLRATLVAGKIPITDAALTILGAGLIAIGQGYCITKFASNKIKTDADLEKDLSRLGIACCTIVDVLDADMSGGCQIEAMLSDAWRGSQLPWLLQELRLLIPQIEAAVAMAAQDGALQRRQQNPETWLFLATHDLFGRLTANDEPGIAGPLHRFTKHFAALIDPGVVVPESEDSFRKRLSAARARRTGKISVLPQVIFPGK